MVIIIFTDFNVGSHLLKACYLELIKACFFNLSLKKRLTPVVEKGDHSQYSHQTPAAREKSPADRLRSDLKVQKAQKRTEEKEE